MYKTNIKPKLSKLTKRNLVIGSLVALVLVGVLYAMFYNKSPKQNVTQNVTSQEEGKINFEPPTEQEKQLVEDNKEQIVANQKTEEELQSTTVSILITDASQYNDTIEVRAYTPDVYESDGTCTYVFTKGISKITKSVASAKDAKTTYCPTLNVPRSDFDSAGNWSLDLSYKSSVSQGSKQTTVKVQ
jgi:hypothetical protein